MGLEKIEPDAGGEWFKKMREAVETGSVPESLADEEKLIKEVQESERKKHAFERTGSHAMAEWQKKQEDKN